MIPFVSSSSSSYAGIFGEALRIIEAAGGILQEQHAKPRTIRQKGRIDLVTQADEAIELFLKNELAPLIPEATFMAEESARSLTLSECCWVIDPIAGTTNFAHGIPCVSTSVALCVQGEVELGVVNAPLINECYVAVRGGGAFCNGQRLAVSAINDVEQSVVATGIPYTIQEDLDVVSRRLHAMLPRFQSVRSFGSSALIMGWVAQGRLDAYYEMNLKPWDVAAGMLLVTEAGGRVSDFSGMPLTLDKGELLMTNGVLHEAVVALL